MKLSTLIDFLAWVGIIGFICAGLVIVVGLDFLDLPGWLEDVSWIVLLVSIACGVVFGIHNHFVEEPKRTKRMESVASTKMPGMRFYPKGELWLEKELSSLKVFMVAGEGSIENMVHGEKEGLEKSIFEYDQAGFDTSYRFTVARYASDQLNLPEFELYPQNPLRRKGIDFPSHPEFSKAYCLCGKDDAAIRDTFRDDVLTYFERRRYIWLRGHGSRLFICWGWGSRAGEWYTAPPDMIPDYLEEGLHIYSLLGG